jgi:Ser/Thr protein kinase RdoA (MazF antagonist)
MNKETIEFSIHEWLFRYFGLEGTLKRLGGENLNYLLTTESGENFVFKAVQQESAEDSADLEFAVLEHARKSHFPAKLPFIIKNYNRNIETGIKIPMYGACSARLISFVDGRLLENYSDISRKLLKNTGKTLAQFDLAIKDFDHPAAHQGHQWELVRAGQHRDKLEFIEDPEQRELVAWAFDLWEEVRDVLPELPHQVIHGDANKGNILAEGDRITGLVDFGDCCYNPRICELAICLSDVMTDCDDPMAAAASVIAGYAGEVELYGEELAVLFPLVCGRLAVTICMAMSRKSAAPDHPNWFVSLEPALGLLGALRKIGLEQMSPQ